jgi:hypothetical protein
MLNQHELTRRISEEGVDLNAPCPRCHRPLPSDSFIHLYVEGDPGTVMVRCECWARLAWDKQERAWRVHQ